MFSSDVNLNFCDSVPPLYFTTVRLRPTQQPMLVFVHCLQIFLLKHLEERHKAECLSLLQFLVFHRPSAQ